MTGRRPADITPSAARLTESLRDIGYDFPAAVADIVDNSVAAGATRVEVTIGFDAGEACVVIADDGGGMTPRALVEALRFGSRRPYARGDLGRYGLGLKTAALSQGRAVTVVTRTRDGAAAALALDLDIIAARDQWLAVEPPPGPLTSSALERLSMTPGTVAIWRKLDRVLPEHRPDGGWARRRLAALADKTAAHLGAVFHRYLEGTAGGGLAITVNGRAAQPWNPFAPGEPGRRELPLVRFEIAEPGAAGIVTLQRFVLPARGEFSSPGEFERYSGPLGWNRQQGFYVYRAARLVQQGGWCGIRGIDEHTKLARAALSFETGLDGAFHVNVAKMRVAVPAQIRAMLDRPVGELAAAADARYRGASRSPGNGQPGGPAGSGRGSRRASPPPPGTGLALLAAAMQIGEYPALCRIAAALEQLAPDVASALGLAGGEPAAAAAGVHGAGAGEPQGRRAAELEP